MAARQRWCHHECLILSRTHFGPCFLVIENNLRGYLGKLPPRRLFYDTIEQQFMISLVSAVWYTSDVGSETTMKCEFIVDHTYISNQLFSNTNFRFIRFAMNIGAES